MEDKVLKELKEIKDLMAHLIGTHDLPKKDRFSKVAIAKAAKEYQKLATERKDWLAAWDIQKVIKSANYECGSFIIEKFNFDNYITRGSTKYYNKTDLIKLGKELKRKNINLSDYLNLVKDKEKFDKKVSSIKFLNSKKNHFNIPADLENINHTPPLPAIETIQAEIDSLLEEYNKFDLSEYISLEYKNTYANYKYEYSFDRYVEPKKKKYCKDFCFKFNYAQEALKKIKDFS